MNGFLVAEVDWATGLTAWATAAGVLVAAIGLGAAWHQLREAGKGLRLSGLAAILQLEADMTARKARVEEVTHDVMILDAKEQLSEKLREAHKKRLNCCLEDWFNAVDRLAFCILKDFVPEKDWRAEYRQYIADIIHDHEPFFRADTRYRNILALNVKWQSQ
jgi:hypothetical protein